MLQPPLLGALAAMDWPTRERQLSAAYEIVAGLHNALGLTPPLSEQVSPFHGRPFLVIHGDRFATALHDAIQDEAVKRLPRWLGNTTQWADSTDVLSSPRWVAPLRALYAEYDDPGR